MAFGGLMQHSMDSSSLASLFLGLFIATVFSTYSISYIYSLCRHQIHQSEPPLLPYWIPYLQHLPAFLLNPASLYGTGRKRFSGKPFTLLLAGTKFHVFSSPKSVSHVFSRSRLFTFEPVMASMMENAVDLPLPDRPKFLSSAGKGTDKRFLTENHNLWTKYLSGERLHDVMDVYMSVLPDVLNSNLDLSDDKWQKKNLYPFLRKLIFETSVHTFFGPRLMHFWPTMWDDWKRFDDATYIGVRSNWAFRLNPKAYRARERMFHAFENWLDATEDDEWEDADKVWCEGWGLRLNWERDELGRQCGFTKRGRACLQASFLFV
jgi:oxysterol 7-alpha-hydroxylase